MSSKRTRVFRSSSFGEIGLLNEVQPIESQVALWEKKQATAAQANSSKPVQKPVENPKVLSVPVPPEGPRRSILTWGSPVRENNNNGSERKPDERFGAFLEACWLCKKRLAEDKDVFMYGYLRAFCSPECRDSQIALDEMDRKPSPVSTAAAFKVTQEPVAKQAQAKRPAVARFK